MCKKKFFAKSHRAIYCSQICGDRFRSKRPSREIQCLWCRKEFVKHFKKGWDKQKFCCIKCRKEYHSFNDKRSPFYKIDKTKKDILKDKKKYVECKICGQLARRRLSTHIRTKHNLSWKEYLIKYPDSQNECKEIRLFAYKYREKRIVEKTLTDKNGWDIITRVRKEKIGNKCEFCGFDKYPEAIIGHHKLPKHLGGKDRIKNCVLLCANCHRHIHKLIREIVSQKKYTIEDIVRTCGKP